MTSNQSIGDITDFYGIYTYQDPLIYFGVENHESWAHREYAVTADWFLKAYIKRLDEEIFSEYPIFTPDIFGRSNENEEEESEDVEIDATMMSATNISEDWDNERFTDLLVKMFDKSRVHSFCVVRLYDTKPYWRVFCDREILDIKYDDNDNPISCTVEWSRSLPYSKQFKIYREEITFLKREDILNLKDGKNYGLLVPFGVSDSEDNIGEYDLEDKWSLSINIRYAMQDVINNSAKSSGFYWLMYGSAIQPTDRQNLLNALDMAGTSRAIGAKEEVLKQMTAMFPAKPEFTLDALQEFIRQFAAACRLPLMFFRSESDKSGLFGGSEYQEDVRVNKKKRFIFSRFKPYIMDLVFMRWGIVVDDVEPYIAETEEEKLNMPINNKEDDKEQDENELNGKKMELIK